MALSAEMDPLDLQSVPAASLANWEAAGCKSRGKLPYDLQWVTLRIEPANGFYFGEPNKVQHGTREPH